MEEAKTETEVKKPVSEWTTEEKQSVVEAFLETAVESVDNQLMNDPDVMEILKQGCELTLVVDEEGTTTYFNKKED